MGLGANRFAVERLSRLPELFLLCFRVFLSKGSHLLEWFFGIFQVLGVGMVCRGNP